jgi:hypothetical protein
MVGRASSREVNLVSSTPSSIAASRRRWGRACGRGGGGDDIGDTCGVYLYCLPLSLSLRTTKTTVSNVEAVFTDVRDCVLFDVSHLRGDGTGQGRYGELTGYNQWA